VLRLVHVTSKFVHSIFFITRPFWEWSSSVLQQIFLSFSAKCPRRAYADGKFFMDIWGIGGIFLSRSYFLGNAPVKTQNFTMAPVGFSTSPNSDMLKGRSGKLLHIYIQWWLVWQAGLSFGRTLPHFFQRRKKRKKILRCQWALFASFFLVLRNPPMEIGEIIGDICCTVGSH